MPTVVNIENKWAEEAKIFGVKVMATIHNENGRRNNTNGNSDEI